MPASAKDRPTLYADLEVVWEAFWTLSAGRQYVSTGVGAIPAPLSFEAIDRYARRFGPHDADAFEEFLILLTTLDREFLEIGRERRAG